MENLLMKMRTFIYHIKTDLSESFCCIIPKVASNSIRVTVGESNFEQFDVLPEKKLYQWCIVRNPFSRLYSCWNSKATLAEVSPGSPSWEEFAEMVIETPDSKSNEHFAGQLYIIETCGFFLDHVMKLEEIATAWPPFARRMGFNSAFAFTNWTRGDRENHTTHLSSYNDSLRDRVYRRYESDFKAFSYGDEFVRQSK